MQEKRRNFALVGQSQQLDGRIHAVRDDLADVDLADRLFAPHYAEPVQRWCSVPFTPLRESAGGPQTSELLLGERFSLLDAAGGWAWGFCASDHYVGYVALDALSETPIEAPGQLPASDLAEAAERYLGMVYLFGGRGGAGIDCSGLVQQAMAAIGRWCPRDSDMQCAEVGRQLEGNEAPARNDLVFFPDHVGIMVNATDMIHATRHGNAVGMEPLAAVVSRIAAKHDPALTAIKRLEP